MRGPRADAERESLRHAPMGDHESRRKTLSDVVVAELRCRSMRCRSRSIGIRRPAELPRWEEHRCGKCGRANPVVVREVLADVELDAASGVLRWSPSDGDPAREREWRYVAMPDPRDLPPPT